MGLVGKVMEVLRYHNRHESCAGVEITSTYCTSSRVHIVLLSRAIVFASLVFFVVLPPWDHLSWKLVVVGAFGHSTWLEALNSTLFSLIISPSFNASLLGLLLGTRCVSGGLGQVAEAAVLPDGVVVGDGRARQQAAAYLRALHPTHATNRTRALQDWPAASVQCQMHRQMGTDTADTMLATL